MSQAATESTTTTEETAGQTSADTSTEEHTSARENSTNEADNSLGDAGKKALDAMKAERKQARDEAATAKAERDALQAKLDGKEAEYVAEQAKRNDRIRRSEVKAAAKGVLQDPTDAYKYLDLDSFEVSDDGDVDESAIADALRDLIEKKPYLAVQDGKRFQGGADGGARKESGNSVDDQIAAAQKAGDLQAVIALKQRKAAELQANKT